MIMFTEPMVGFTPDQSLNSILKPNQHHFFLGGGTEILITQSDVTTRIESELCRRKAKIPSDAFLERTHRWLRKRKESHAKRHCGVWQVSATEPYLVEESGKRDK